MNYRDRSPNTMGSGGLDGDGDGGRGGGRGRGGRGRFRGGFRGNFRRGDGRNMNDRPSPWKDTNDDRFENKNTGSFGGGRSFGGFNDHRDGNRDNRDFGPNRDSNRSFGGGMNQRGPPLDANKWKEPAIPPKTAAPPPVSTPSSTSANRVQRTNDVEIIVTHKSLTKYAEFIEHRLKSTGFNVDLLFPNEEVPLGRVLGNIASRGTLYALVVTQLSEEHRSVTINILYGQTQEHRNMPLDNGLLLIAKNFESFTKGERVPVIAPPGAVSITPAGTPLGEKHPEFIVTLLNNLIENRALTVIEYDKLIGYLQEKRDKFYKNELPSAKSDSGSQNSKTHLENRILNILASSENKLNDKPIGLLPPTQQPNPSILKDTSTLKALQTIVQNNLLGPRGPRI